MDFDSLKSVRSTSVKTDYSDKKKAENENIKAKDVSKELNTVVSEKAAMSKSAEVISQEKNKYNEDDLYKGEKFQRKMEKAISEANKILKPANKSFSYSVHDETNKVVIQIKDNSTGEVIKEIPSEESLDMVAKMRELAGIVIDEKR